MWPGFQVSGARCLAATTLSSAERTRSKGSSRSTSAHKRLMHEWQTVQKLGQALYPDGSFQNVQSTRENSTSNDPNKWFVRLGPCRGNLLEWHFTVEGPPSSPYAGGLYHGRVLLSRDYPAKAPRIQMLNQSGRFRQKTDICLSASSYHQETWRPSWTVRTLVTALAPHMLSPAVEIGGVDQTYQRRRAFAEKSRSFRCPLCGCDHTLVGRGFQKHEEALLPEDPEEQEFGGAEESAIRDVLLEEREEAQRLVAAEVDPGAERREMTRRFMASLAKSRTIQVTVLLIFLLQLVFKPLIK
eukprot:scaffold438_cov250-Pinguiococcus_pyrenoidosus.AAC.21